MRLGLLLIFTPILLYSADFFSWKAEIQHVLLKPSNLLKPTILAPQQLVYNRQRPGERGIEVDSHP